MRIGLDISSATPGRTGIGTYTYELVRRLVRCSDHDWVLLFNSLRQSPPDLPEFRAKNVTVLRRRLPGPLLLKGWQHLDLPDVEALTRGPVDLFHSPSTYVPPQRRGARVTTVHDLYFMEPGAKKAPLGGKYLDWVVAHRLGQMNAIITDAASVARQLEALMAERGGKGAAPIFPIPLGVDPRFFDAAAPADLDRVRRAYALPERFVLHLGGNEPRKNRDRLTQAFRDWHRASDSRHNLALVVNGDWEHNADMTMVRAVGNIAHEDLPAVYRLAAALVFPSLHEGFGLPVLEAMASGTPVLTSSAVAVTEYLPPGTVALCDPTDISSITTMLAHHLDHPDRLQALSLLGPETAARFTWEETARLTLQAYEQALRSDQSV